MKWFTAEYERADAKEPHEVRVYLKDGYVYREEFYEDLVYHPAAFSPIDLDLGTSARAKAISYAYRVIKSGFYIKCEHPGKPHADELHPPHKIDKIEIVRCKWEIVPTDDVTFMKVDNNAAQE
jgi:hypothetical protein